MRTPGIERTAEYFARAASPKHAPARSHHRRTARSSPAEERLGEEIRRRCQAEEKRPVGHGDRSGEDPEHRREVEQESRNDRRCRREEKPGQAVNEERRSTEQEKRRQADDEISSLPKSRTADAMSHMASGG